MRLMDKFSNEWILSRDEEFRYMLLSRMQSDCLYYLGNGNRHGGRLWAGNEKDQIDTMRAIWDSFPADKKPEWLTREQIDEFEAQMINEENNDENEAEDDWEM